MSINEHGVRFRLRSSFQNYSSFIASGDIFSCCKRLFETV